MAVKRKYDSGADAARMTEDDYLAVQKYGQDWAEASKAGNQAGMQAAHDAAESVRAKYGYSGGEDGSGYQKNQSEDQAPAYISRYQSQLGDAMDRYLNRESFSYDPEKDQTYQQLKEQYTRNGQRAMEDTLGQISARTGGLASSYASAAAQQTYDGYMAELADRVPQLRQLAYEMYLDEGNALKDRVSLLQGLENNDYGRYQDRLGQWNTDRSFQYGVSRDQVSDSRYADETAWNRGKYTEETEYSRALEKAKTLGAAGDFSGYKALGYTDQDIANLKEAYDREQSLKAYVGRSGSGSGGSGKPSMTLAQANSAIKDGRVTQAVVDAYNYYMGEGAYEDQYARGLESISYSPDEGIFDWNGGKYSLRELKQALENTWMTDDQWNKLMKALWSYGFSFDFG